MVKPTLMIHDMREEFFELPLDCYTLTFDDGLFSQWYYLDRLANINTEKIFFISTDFLSSGQQSLDFPLSCVAHEKGRSGNFEDFMTVQQVQQIMNTPNCRIGGHGHKHIRLREVPRAIDRIKHIKDDTEQMLAAFRRLFNVVPTTFCYPYNEDLIGLYTGMLRQYGFTEFFGRERIAIETLLPGRLDGRC